MESFEYLKKSECYEVKNVNDVELYREVQDSFQTMNFQQREQEAIWAIVASILCLGNINFDDSVYDDSNLLIKLKN